MTEEWTHEAEFSIAAEPDRVFAALTAQAELERWFAEHARVQARPDGAYRFWGRHTVGTPGESDATGRVIDLEPNTRLSFEWRLFGTPSRVTITLESTAGERGPTTTVTVRHVIAGSIDQPRWKELIDDWWRLAMGNLAAHVTGQGAGLRPDFTDPNPEIRMSIVVQAPPDKVFRALTEPAALNQWFAKDAVVEPRVGGRFDLGFKAGAGVPADGPTMAILEFVPNEKLVIGWPDWRGDRSVPAQSVTWVLEPTGKGTKVTLVHAGFVRGVDLSDYPFGWRRFLSRMAEVAVTLDD